MWTTMWKVKLRQISCGGDMKRRCGNKGVFRQLLRTPCSPAKLPLEIGCYPSESQRWDLKPLVGASGWTSDPFSRKWFESKIELSQPRGTQFSRGSGRQRKCKKYCTKTINSLVTRHSLPKINEMSRRSRVLQWPNEMIFWFKNNRIFCDFWWFFFPSIFSNINEYFLEVSHVPGPVNETKISLGMVTVTPPNELFVLVQY